MAHQPVDLPPEMIITATELKDKLSKESVYVIDVRNPSEIQGTISANQSINIPFPEIEEALKATEEVFQSKYGVDKPNDKGENVVFHCGKGARGSKATKLAMTLGFEKAQNLDGGYISWETEVVKK